MKEVIDQFVCVRVVKANDLDLTLFQFDWDLTFSVFFMNADTTIYGRYGTRTSRDDATKDISLSGLAKSMAAALAVHAEYPANKSSLQGKQPVATEFKSPNEFPSLRGKFENELDYQGAVTRSCLHCHQVLDARRQIHRDAGQPIPERLLFPYPSPTVVGLTFDPRRRATVTEVRRPSPAARGGFRPGDELIALDGQPILSVADVQWVLQNAGRSDELAATVRRGGEQTGTRLKLDDGWRRASDISWRVSSWPLRRMGTGGVLFESASVDQRRSAGVADDALALRVSHLGQHGPHGAAKRAGFAKGDVVVSFNGQTSNMSPSQLLAYAARNTKPGELVPVTVARGDQRLELKLPMQK